MDGDGSRPPQTMGEPSSNGGLESVVGEPRSAQFAAPPTVSIDGQAPSRGVMSPVSSEEISRVKKVENGVQSRAEAASSLSAGILSCVSDSSCATQTPEEKELSVNDESLKLFGLKNISRAKVGEVLGKKVSERTASLGRAYMSLFDFGDVSVVEALRILLERCSIIGETQAQERIVQAFAHRYAECNGSVGDSDAVHSLTAAIMLLNQDLHGQNLGKKMTTSQFMSNVALLRDRKMPIPKSIVKEAYSQIKSRSLQFTADDYGEDTGEAVHRGSMQSVGTVVLPNSMVEVDLDSYPTVLREGLLKRKNVGGGFGHRSWSLRYCVVRGFVFHLFKTDSKSSKAVPNFADMSSAVILTHALATPAARYHKRLHCMQVLDSDGTYHLLQASNYDDLMSWVIAINRAAALYSHKPLAAPCGSSDKFERPMMPRHPSAAGPDDQLQAHREKVDDLLKQVTEEQEYKPDAKKKRLLKVWETRFDFMREELVRYQSYVEALTLDHEFAPSAKHGSELLSPTHSVSSIASSTSQMSVRSTRSTRRGMRRVSPQVSNTPADQSFTPESRLQDSAHSLPLSVTPSSTGSPPPVIKENSDVPAGSAAQEEEVGACALTPAYKTITPPPGGNMSAQPGSRDSYREAVSHT